MASNPGLGVGLFCREGSLRQEGVYRTFTVFVYIEIYITAKFVRIKAIMRTIQ